jgi:hypothetical protein
MIVGEENDSERNAGLRGRGRLMILAAEEEDDDEIRYDLTDGNETSGTKTSQRLTRKESNAMNSQYLDQHKYILLARSSKHESDFTQYTPEDFERI